jgi:hypothetical protein
MKNASAMREMPDTGPIRHISVQRLATLANSLDLNGHSLLLTTATQPDPFIGMSTVGTFDIESTIASPTNRGSVTQSPRRTP